MTSSLTRINSNAIAPAAVTSEQIAEGAVTSDKIAGSVSLGGPRVTGLDYPGDDTAALPAGGQTIVVNGGSFQSGCTIFIDGTAVGVVSFLSETQLQFVAPAKSVGLYAFYVVNPDGGTAILVPGMVYSGTPTWSTASGSLGAPYETAAFSVNLSATGDGNLTYAVASGSSLPSGLTLSSGGTLSGTVPATNNDTTYTFNLEVIDSENQSTTRQFSVTYKVDVVTWASPAADSSYTLTQNTAMESTALSASSAAGKSISYAVQSGSLPTGVSIAGSNISGTPSGTQSSTAVTVRATAASTARTSDRTFYFTVNPGAVSSVDYLVAAGGGGGSYGGFAVGYNGGGGAGGVLYGSLGVSSGVALTITVGSGGNVGSNGGNSVFSSITATGGGVGCTSSANGQNGGSGGGGWSNRTAGSGVAGPPRQGYDGGTATSNYAGGGGGGAGAVGGGGANNTNGSYAAPRTEYTGPRGGDGLADAALGSILSATTSGESVNSTRYIGGGGGGGTGARAHYGGYGGGGLGGNGYDQYLGSQNGLTNTGGGGGGGAYTSGGGSGGSGGSGLVIIRYADTFPAAVSTTGSPEVITSGGYRYYKFTGSGTITF